MRNADSWAPTKIRYEPASDRYVPGAAHVARGSRLAVHAMIPSYVRVIAEHARGRLLDCGCGNVPYYGLYRAQVDEVICVDWASTNHGRVHLDFEVDLNEPLPFPPAEFDTVLLADVLEHIAVPDRLVRELGRILRPNGKLIVMVPFLYNLHEAPHDYYRYTRHGLETLLQNAALTPVELFAYGGYPDVLLDLISKGLSPFHPVCDAFVGVAAPLTRTGWYRSWRARTSQRFPLGYCCVAQKA
jgi:SAM-dependent methyltransferase